MERQGDVGDLDRKSSVELSELLSRQERILHNQRFIQTLPDKGKKILEFVERIRHTLLRKEEEEKKQRSLASVRTEFQARYEQAFTSRRRSATSGQWPEQKEDSSDSNSAEASHLEVGGVDGKVTEHSCKDVGEGDTELVEALQRVTLSKEKDAGKEPATNSAAKNPFLGSQTEKKPHYITVLEKTEGQDRKPRFKPNQLKSSLSPGQSPGSVSPLSAEARRQMDKKHLDDVTAAKLPPLHHSPAQILSLEESVTLLQEQTKKYQELQAQLAARKLAEGLTMSMNSYNPEGGALAAYREVHDHGAASDDE